MAAEIGFVRREVEPGVWVNVRATRTAILTNKIKGYLAKLTLYDRLRGPEHPRFIDTDALRADFVAALSDPERIRSVQQITRMWRVHVVSRLVRPQYQVQRRGNEAEVDEAKAFLSTLGADVALYIKTKDDVMQYFCERALQMHDELSRHIGVGRMYSVAYNAQNARLERNPPMEPMEHYRRRQELFAVPQRMVEWRFYIGLRIRRRRATYFATAKKWNQIYGSIPPEIRALRPLHRNEAVDPGNGREESIRRARVYLARKRAQLVEKLGQIGGGGGGVEGELLAEFDEYTASNPLYPNALKFVAKTMERVRVLRIQRGRADLKRRRGKVAIVPRNAARPPERQLPAHRPPRARNAQIREMRRDILRDKAHRFGDAWPRKRWNYFLSQTSMARQWMHHALTLLSNKMVLYEGPDPNPYQEAILQLNQYYEHRRGAFEARTSFARNQRPVRKTAFVRLLRSKLRRILNGFGVPADDIAVLMLQLRTEPVPRRQMNFN